MAAAIDTAEVRRVLAPWLGGFVMQAYPVIAEEAAFVLRSYAPYRESLDEMEKRLGSCLFGILYQVLGKGMRVYRGGREQRILVSDLELMTDDLMGVLFDSLSPYSVNYQSLKDYSMRRESLAALRVLYQKYEKFESPEEREMVKRLIVSVYPPSRYRDWLEV